MGCEMHLNGLIAVNNCMEKKGQGSIFCDKSFIIRKGQVFTHTLQCYRPCPSLNTHFFPRLPYSLCRQVWCEHIVILLAAFCSNQWIKRHKMKDVVLIFSTCGQALRKHTPSTIKKTQQQQPPPPRSDLPVTSCWNPDQMSQIWKWNKQANYAAPRAPHNELLDHLWLLTLKAIELSGRTCGHISKQGGKTRAEISIPGRKQKVQIRLQLEELYNKSITTSSAAMKI